MLIISDTTPLISLMKAGHLQVLKSLFSNVIIPSAVFNELVSNKDFSEEAEKIKLADFINVKEVENLDSVKLLKDISGLDAGEAEAIALSRELNASLLLIDEAHGRKVAQQMNVPITGTVGILKSAFLNSLLTKDEIVLAVEKLKASRRFIGEDLLNSLLEL